MTGRFARELASAPVSGPESLHDREGDLAVVRDALARAQHGSGSLTLVSGGLGIGKSSLLGAAKAAASQQGMRVLTARGRESECDYTFGVTLQLLESHIARAKPQERGRLLSGAARSAASLFAAGPRDALPAGHPFPLLHGLYWLCANLAGERPLAVCIDDAQWADAGSLRFVLYLAQRLTDLPVALLIATDLGGRPHRSQLLDDIAAYPEATVLRLRPLSAPSVAELLRSTRFPAATDEFCVACFDATGGNPFLLRELSDELAARGIEPTEEGARELSGLGPQSVAKAVFRRLRSSSRGAEELASAVAVLGEGAELRHAARLAGLHHSEAGRIADELASAGLLHRADRLGFVHPAVRAAVYAHRPPAERAEAHLRAARMLYEERFPAEELASHLLRARRSGADWAVDALLAAAEPELAEGVPERAIEYLRRALEEPPTDRQRAKVLLELGRAEAITGDPHAVDRLRTAMELMEDATERGATALEASRTLHAQGRSDSAAQIIRQGLEGLGGRNPGLRERLETALASVSGQDAAGAAGRRSKAVARPELARRAFQAALGGEPRERTLELARRALGEGTLLREETSDDLAYYLAVNVLTFAEDLSTAEAALDAAVEDARDRGSVLGFATASHWRSLARLRLGKLDDAAADATNAVAAQRHGWRFGLPAAHAVLAATLIERGDLEAASYELSLGADPDDAVDELTLAAHRAGQARLSMLRGAPAAARDKYLECGRIQAAAGATNPAVLQWRAGAAHAMAQLGELDSARSLIEEELRLARSFGAPGPIGRALHARGLIEGLGEALGSLRDCVAVLERSEAVLDRARALVDLGALLRRAGQRRQARDPLRQGLHLAERCGARLLVERAQEELVAAGARPRRAALSGPEALTARERQVAALAANGMSNRGIGEALFVTVKTVEWHLHHSYEKLGVSSRQELRAAMGEVE